MKRIRTRSCPWCGANIMGSRFTLAEHIMVCPAEPGGQSSESHTKLPPATTFDKEEDIWFKPVTVVERVPPMHYYHWHLLDPIGTNASLCGCVAKGAAYDDECFDALPIGACAECLSYAPERLMRIDVYSKEA